MARIGILTCSNATQDLGCSSVSCLADLRKRRGTFKEYPADEPLDLVGIINCPGCPTLTGPDKLLLRIRALTEFRTGAIHFANCVKALCPFQEQYRRAVESSFPGITVVIGTHQEHITPEEFRSRVKRLFNQKRKTMVDMILDRDKD
ncbi:MAG: CGGC domain-containing protein [Nitrospirae bacterium]|nr:CGGC domain-containing protein [Nitrospirota bacterium]NTW66619.1 CGGC domain-containing protein [Nitrospirota bacterium]